MLTGENGILTQAQKAKDETEKATIEEKRKIAQTEAAMNLTKTQYNGVPIPVGCAPTRINGESEIDEGLVIIDKNGNEWVWIEVPKNIYANTSYNGGSEPTGADDYEKIESVLKAYSSEYIYDSNLYKDVWYSEEQHGFATAKEYNNLKNKMLKSIYENGGFYIGKYETGSKNERKKDSGINDIPVIQENMYPYSYVTCKQAETLSESLSSEENTTSLLFGIQWNLVLKFIETKNGKTHDELSRKDAMTWGNTLGSTFVITRGKYCGEKDKIWNDVKNSYTKEKGKVVLFTTGVTSRNSSLNIYDLNGNAWEWTLESNIDKEYPCVVRGGACNLDYSAKSYTNYDTSYNNWGFGFRIALY